MVNQLNRLFFIRRSIIFFLPAPVKYKSGYGEKTNECRMSAVFADIGNLHIKNASVIVKKKSSFDTVF